MQETDSKHAQDTVSRDEPGQTTDYKHDSEPDNSSHESANLVRPPIVYTSLREFLHSFIKRFKSLWTRSFILSLLAGQVVSLCITCTSVTTTELVGRNWILPTTQTFFLYLSLFLIYTPYTMYQYGFKGWAQMVLRDGWRYFILASCDVEGNFLVVKAYDYTDLLSCILLDAWAIPICLFFSWLYMRTKYHWTQILGVFVCIAGLGLLVFSDHLTDKNDHAWNKSKGDAFMIAGATLYGISNATEEWFVRRSPLYEVVGQMGMWGALICGTQAACLEHDMMKTAPWNAFTIGILIAYTASMVILYTVAPLLYRLASSAYFNLSLLSSDFYSLLFGLFLFHYAPYWLYFVAFSVVISGLIIYFWHATPEQQGILDPRAPAYVNRKHGGGMTPAEV
jgi:solute carrier family 35 protein F1/2